jgi:thiamine monophosphate synthase
LLGASVHSPEEALTAWTNGADFLLAGTIFASHTHPNEPPSGIDLLYTIITQLPTPPIVGTGLAPVRFSPAKRFQTETSPVHTEKATILAIGGITSANARQVMEAGADGIAVISAILSTANIKEAVSELRIAINPKESRETP